MVFIIISSFGVLTCHGEGIPIPSNEFIKVVFPEDGNPTNATIKSVICAPIVLLLYL